jgi:hypothetical protein
MNEDDYQRLVARRQRIAAHSWGQKTHEVESDFPFLIELEDRFPKEVKHLRRVWANERIVTERIEHKRLTNPDHEDSRAYNRLLRKRDKLNRQGKLLLNELVLLAAIDDGKATSAGVQDHNCGDLVDPGDPEQVLD